MDDRDLHVITAHMSGILRLVQELDAVSNVHTQGKVELGNFEIVLTPGQKVSIKDSFDNFSARITTAADNLDTPTGKTGIADTVVLTRIQQSAQEGLSFVEKQIEALQVALRATTNLQPDDTLRVVFSDAQAQEVANIAKTSGEVFKILLAILGTRFR